MIQKVLKVGTSAAVTIPNELVKEFGFAIGTPVEVSFDKTTGTVSYHPANSKAVSPRAQKITDLALGFVERYRDDLEALAKE